MKRGGWILVCVSGTILLSAGARGNVADSNPYKAIVERNVFGLRPPPPPPEPTVNKPPPPNIYLTGITTILGPKQALLKIPGMPAKAGEPAKGEQSYTLAEGQGEGDLTVLAIDAKERIVKVNYAGTVLSLNFEDNGVKAPATGKPAAAQGVAATERGAGPIPPPRVFSFSRGTGADSAYPRRTVRLPMGAQTSGTRASAGSPNAFASYGSGGSPTQPTQPAQEQNSLTPEQATVLIELNRERLKEQGSPIANILPPTELTPSPPGPDQQPQGTPQNQLAPQPPPIPGRPLPLPGRPF